MEPRFTAWSYSRLSDYRKCPHMAKCKHLLKMGERENEAMKRGASIHKDAEQYVNGTKRLLPASLKPFEQANPGCFKELKKLKAKTEQQWAFDQDWNPTGWFAPNAWVRMVIDVSFDEDELAQTIDYKTGKVREENDEQLILYNLGSLIMKPELNSAMAEFWYLDQNVRRSVIMPRAELAKSKKSWERQVKKMMSDTKFKPTPGDACRWCHLSAARGGNCKF